MVQTQFTSLFKLSLKEFNLLLLSVNSFYVIARFRINSVNFLKFLPYNMTLIRNFVLIRLYFVHLGAQCILLYLCFVQVFLNHLLRIVNLRLLFYLCYA